MPVPGPCLALGVPDDSTVLWGPITPATILKRITSNGIIQQYSLLHKKQHVSVCYSSKYHTKANKSITQNIQQLRIKYCPRSRITAAAGSSAHVSGATVTEKFWHIQ